MSSDFYHGLLGGVDYSVVQDGASGDGAVFPGTGNIDEDPQFFDALGPDEIAGTEDDNLRLMASSPAIDVGDPDFVPQPGETDLDGNLRVVAGRVDMGAYEFQGSFVNMASAVLGEPGFAKNRYISFAPGSAGEITALRVTLVQMPPAFAAWEGLQMWVGPPSVVTESPQSTAGTPAPTFTTARLQCTPYYRDWGAEGVIHVSDDAIVPSRGASANPNDLIPAVYAVQSIHYDCDPEDDLCYSAPLTITQSKWGDITSGLNSSGEYYDPPDGLVTITDVTAVVDKYQGKPFGPVKARSDLDPNVPDWLITIQDVTRASDASQGKPYPFAGPSGCP